MTRLWHRLTTMNLRRRLTNAGHAITGSHALPDGMTARVRHPAAGWETLTVHVHGQTLAVTYPTEHDCEG